MAWTAPQTWTLGQVVQPSDMNTQVRDNLGETAAAKAATTGYLFRVTGVNELEEVQDQTTGWLDASSAILPSGAFDSAAQRQLVESASERFWYELLFDDASTRYAQWQVALPRNADLRDATITIVWKAAATTGKRPLVHRLSDGRQRQPLGCVGCFFRGRRPRHCKGDSGSDE